MTFVQIWALVAIPLSMLFAARDIITGRYGWAMFFILLIPANIYLVVATGD